uniref:Uncharacterized protein n=1 Tax=Toxoplasma gondii TgCATBr9 TaxID=943120 RepID=A0A2T6J5R3_TOXGO|nr:hypothetical protein TGBR9_380330 [Toxoplasma gondii TgCATBr9]
MQQLRRERGCCRQFRRSWEVAGGERVLPQHSCVGARAGVVDSALRCTRPDLRSLQKHLQARLQVPLKLRSRIPLLHLTLQRWTPRRCLRRRLRLLSEAPRLAALHSLEASRAALGAHRGILPVHLLRRRPVSEQPTGRAGWSAELNRFRALQSARGRGCLDSQEGRRAVFRCKRIARRLSRHIRKDYRFVFFAGCGSSRSDGELSCQRKGSWRKKDKKASQEKRIQACRLWASRRRITCALERRRRITHGGPDVDSRFADQRSYLRTCGASHT